MGGIVKNQRVFMCDFETTVYEGQEHTEVWASAVVELYTEDVLIFHSIDETFDYLTDLNGNLTLYYHNLKFDGAFWLSYLLVDCGFTQAIELTADGTPIGWMKNRDMPNNSFKYTISDMGQWYTITIKQGKRIIEIRDSLKLLPFSVKRIGESFKTKHKKLDMEYKGFRYAGCTITDEEKEYIANDVLVVKEALEIMYNEGHNKLTIGACCLSEFKKTHKPDYEELFPDLYNIKIDKEIYGSENAGQYIRRSYKGGWCYLVKGKAKQLKTNGCTADVNSLYPSMMSSESGNYYPVRKPIFWNGDYIPFEAKRPNTYYFVRVKTRFKLKGGYLPFISIKGNPFYNPNESLTTSDIYDKKTGKYYEYYTDLEGNIKLATVTLTLTMTDYALIKEHYILYDTQILDGCYFWSECGLFDEYIEEYKRIKITSKGARRELAKLFLNNLYGKMASNTNSSYKIAYLKDDKSIGFKGVQEDNKKAGYIPIGSAITSYARNFTIRTAQKNYHGDDKQGFIYADTDSIHCDLSPDEIVGVNFHDTDFCCWKLESEWDVAYFTRQKTYIEHLIKKDGESVTPQYLVKCAGMPEKSKNLFVKSLEGSASLDDEMTEAEKDFLFKDGKPIIRTLDDFDVGLVVPGKLLPKRISGGIVLVDTNYQMR